MRKPGSDPMIMEAAFHLWSAATCRSFFSCDRQILLDVRGILRDSIKSGDKSPHCYVDVKRQVRFEGFSPSCSIDSFSLSPKRECYLEVKRQV
jgi:hypothetical protein